MNATRIVDRQEQRLSNWVTVIARTIEAPQFTSPQIFHSLKQSDYVAVLAVTAEGKIPLVRQYRPALETDSLELPSGLLEAGEDPEATAARELYEETGYQLSEKLISLGCLNPDTGRLSNRLWCFFARNVIFDDHGDWQPEVGIEPVLLSKTELEAEIVSGAFKHALNLALLAIAQVRGVF